MTSDNSDATSSSRITGKIVKRLRNTFKRTNTGELCDMPGMENLDEPRIEMIRGILELPTRIARDIMIPRVDIIAVESSIELKPLIKLIHEEGHSRLPVYEEKIDTISGILYVKDLLKLLIDKSRKKFQLKKILHSPYFIPETMPLDELMIEFRKRKNHLAIVVDEYGGVAGIVTLEDILEEIVGEITDEYDIDELPEFEKKNASTYEVDSRLAISEFNEKLDADLPDHDFDTIGGYVLDLFGKVPAKGEEVTAGKLSFKIKDISGTIINRIVVTVIHPE